MRKKKQNQKRMFSIFASFLMIFSLITPGFAAAESSNKISHSVNGTQTSAKDKMSDRLLSEFNDNDKVTFLVKFKEKSNPMNIANEAKKNAQSKQLTGQQARFQQRSAVLADLKSVALESQYNVIEYLEDETKSGNVEDFQSFHIVNGMAVTATKEVAEKIAAFAEVDKILPNEERQLHETIVKTDEVAPQSSLTNVEWNVDRVNAPDAWALGIDGTGTVVGSLDTGVQWNHPALMEKYRGYNASNGSVDHQFSWFDASTGQANPLDDHGHGTHVTGTMVGAEPNGTNQVGVAPGAKWIATKVFNSLGNTTDAILLNAAQWMLAPGGDVNMAPDVVNNSWGGGPGLDEWYRDAVIAWRASDIFPEFSAGNTTLSNPGGPGSVAVPANYPESFATGATDINDKVASFSLRGPSPYGEIKPDIIAPGVNIRSSVPGSGYEGGWNGTSMSGPALAGVAALLRQVNANISVDEMEQVLLTTTTPLTDAQYPESPNHGYGYGLVDAYEAVSSILDGLGTVKGQVMQDGEDSEAPTYEHEAPSETYAGMDLNLSVFARDNVSVTSVQLSYLVDGDWNTVDVPRKSGDYTSGNYGVTIPGGDIAGNSFNYKWIINDYGNNTVESDEYVVEVKAGITTGYFENFDSNEPVGWYSQGANDSWEWGAPTSGPGEAYSGENAYATNLAGNYANSMNATLIMPPVDLPEGPSFLQFKNWHEFEESTAGRAWDYGHVVVSTDGVTWTEVQMFQGLSDGWLSTEIDLSEYSGRVYLGFKVFSDGSGPRSGWYIDDVALSETSQYSNDDEAPVINHTGPTEVYSGMDLVLKAQVTDNLRLSYVLVNYLDTNGDWQQIQATQDSGNDQAGQFSATIPGDQITGESITYNWEASDYGGNVVTTDDHVVTVVPGISVGYFEDFEGTPAGWYSFGANNTWEMGVPTSGPNGAASGENVYATNLVGDYKSSMNATLVMPAIDLPEGEAYLNFKNWHNFEQSTSGTAWDYGHVVVSTDQVNWTNLQKFQGLTSDWTDVSIDLSAYAGQRIYVGFHGYSDGSVVRPGWYIDDVGLSTTPTATGEKLTKQVENAPSTLPLRAQVSILENGRSVFTNPADGSYSLSLPVGEFTVEAGAYGFASAQKTVTIADGEESIANFTLEELAQGTVSGQVTNIETGTAISEATLLLIEDANVQPVETDDSGNFTLSAYEGTYTLKVVASNFHSKEVEITIGSDPIEVNLELDPYYTYPGGEIGYDDGTAENARAFYDAGNGWGVKMSLPEGESSGIVTDGVFRFWDTEWPIPGGTEFAVEVWDAGSNGMPGQKLAGPIDATALRDGTWTTVNLRDHNIVVNGDFYMVYIQTGTNPNVPGLGTDEDGPNAKRSYQYVSGAWTPSPADEGNYMIRARVDYEVAKPMITTPEASYLTNEESITIEGTASPTTSIQLSNNGEEVGTAVVADNGLFSFTTDLTEGDNEFIATTLIGGDAAGSSESVTVTLDTVAPSLSIDSPSNGDVINTNTVVVEGTASDEHLDYVDVNGQEVAVEDGNYSKRIIVEEGTNEITVTAYDLAGNSETQTVTIMVNSEAPVIENLQPETDVTVEPGDEVVVSFNSLSEGGEASFTVQIPSGQSPQSSASVSMEEVSTGYYEGTWVAPNAHFENGVISVEFTDAAGNRTTAEATGTITVVGDEVEEPEEPEVPGEIDRIFGADRYQTAIEISQNGWETADTVIIARGDNFADALAGVPLAHVADAPILLTQTNKLSDGVLAEIDRLGASIVIVLGGESAVGAGVSQELSNANLEVNRVSGSDRFATAAAISRMVAPNGSDEVVIANGMDFPDALSVASYAAQAGTPILLTTTDAIPERTQAAIDQLGATSTIVVGGKTVVSEAVENELPNATRLGGADRYETNTLIATHYGVDSDHLYVATGTGYADALTGAVLAAKDNSAVLLVHAKVPGVVSDYITNQEVRNLTIFGGMNAVSQKVADELAALIQ